MTHLSLRPECSWVFCVHIACIPLNSEMFLSTVNVLEGLQLCKGENWGWAYNFLQWQSLSLEHRGCEPWGWVSLPHKSRRALHLATGHTDDSRLTLLPVLVRLGRCSWAVPKGWISPCRTAWDESSCWRRKEKQKRTWYSRCEENRWGKKRDRDKM